MIRRLEVVVVFTLHDYSVTGSYITRSHTQNVTRAGCDPSSPGLICMICFDKTMKKKEVCMCDRMDYDVWAARNILVLK